MKAQRLNWFRAMILLVMLVLCPLFMRAQELNCSVEVNTDKIAGTDKDVFTTLQSAITEYMNNTQWGNAQFLANERIECKLFLTVNSYEGTTMKCDLQVQSLRPVYNSSYTTTLINFKDTNVEFDYQENEPLIYSENTMESNLTAILNFYAFLILAVDFDSFSPNGGDLYFEKANNVVTMAQSSGESGWKAFEDNKNRSAVLSAYTDNATHGIRTILYNYHRLGLDQMAVSVDKGRASVTACIEELKKVYDAAPMSVCLSIFRDAKLDELVNIYSEAGTTEKTKVYELLYPLYPTEGTRLDKIKKTEK